MKALITKSLSLKQTNLLISKGIIYDCLPFMSYHASNTDEATNELLKQNEDVTWVFTSRRAVKSIQALLKGKTAPTQILTVGKQAALLLNQLNFKVDFIGKTSEDLLAFFAKNSTKQLNYFRGRYHRNTIPSYCKTEGIDYRDVECYYAIKNKPEIDINQYTSIWIFSPINGKLAAEIEAVNFDMPVYAIGPVTKAALQQAGFKNIISPQNPSFENVANLYLTKNKNV